MNTHLIKPGTSVEDMRLRCGDAAIDCDGFVASEDSINHVDCPGCLRDLIVEMRLKEHGYDTPEARWICGGDTGTSSITIWSVMTGSTMPRGRRPSVPWDPADFGRCHRLLDLFPHWRERMPEVADRYPEWSGLVAAWDELTALYLEELPSGRAPRLYARMKALMPEFGR